MAKREKIWGRPKPVLTCPFCGGLETVLLTLASREDPKSQHYAVMCKGCMARGPVKETPADANERWREREPAK